MGRTLTAEKQLENALKSLLVSSGAGGSNAKRGILVGHAISDTRDHLLAIVPIPVDETSKEANDTTIIDHAEKVSEMLPGGIHVLGLAVQVSNAELKSSQPHLKHLLTSVWKRSKCVSNNYWVELNGCDYQLLLYFNKESKKFRFHWLQVSAIQSTLQPGSDIKFIPDPPSLLCIESFINLPLNTIVSHDQLPTNILQDSIKELCSTVLSSVAMIKNRDNIPADSEPLEKIFPKGPGKKNASLMIIHLLCPLSHGKADGINDRPPQTVNNVINVRVVNGIHCRVYLPITAKWSQLVMALKLDGIKSLIIRKNLLLDELSEIESTFITNEQKMLLSQRVWLTDSTLLRFSLTDYATIEETDDDIMERVWSVWGKKGKYSISYTENYKEKETRNEKDLISQNEKDHKEPTMGEYKSSSTWYTIAAIIVLLIGLIVTLLLS